MDMPVTIIVSENHIGLTQGSRVQTGTIKNGKSELMVMNSSGASLPSTGGPGTTLLYLLGIMLTVFAGACLVMRRRMRDAA
jgi:LPXTG-motif cell wall-anchored protein